ncbi:MAG: fibronectin type III domain-containing protein [Phycisphaerales bacterium]|nr:fibronectin type III domain-containing protein [Phycisphaerales bacterium]
MGTNLPRKQGELIQWAEAHGALWAVAPTTVGLTAALTTEYQAAVSAAKAAVLTAEKARLASKNATQNLDDQLSSLRDLSGALIEVIKAFARSTCGEGVFALAGISPPAPPGTVGTPAQPTNLKVSLNPTGSLTVTWKATQPAGASNTVYMIKRKLPGQSVYTLVDTVGGKRFTDNTLPIGVDGVSYIVQSKRGEERSPDSEAVSVTFGSVAGGPGGFGQPGTAIVATIGGSAENAGEDRAAA